MKKKLDRAVIEKVIIWISPLEEINFLQLIYVLYLNRRPYSKDELRGSWMTRKPNGGYWNKGGDLEGGTDWHTR